MEVRQWEAGGGTGHGDEARGVKARLGYVQDMEMRQGTQIIEVGMASASIVSSKRSLLYVASIPASEIHLKCISN